MIPVPPVAARLARRLPSWGRTLLRVIWQAFWAWYRRLSLLPMFLVTCVIGAAMIVAVDQLPLSSAQHTQLRDLASGLLVVAVLVVIVTGAVRSRR